MGVVGQGEGEVEGGVGVVRPGNSHRPASLIYSSLPDSEIFIV